MTTRASTLTSPYRENPFACCHHVSDAQFFLMPCQMSEIRANCQKTISRTPVVASFTQPLVWAIGVSRYYGHAKCPRKKTFSLFYNYACDYV